VLNKIDLLSAEELLSLKKRASPRADSCALYTSVPRPSTLEPLRQELKRRIRDRMQLISVEFPARAGRVLSALYERGEVLSRSQQGTMVTVVAKAPPALVGWLRSRGGVRVSEGV
jgi:50S ribosomal subunit-associated GTPase HflX